MSLALAAVLAQAGDLSVAHVPTVETGPKGLLRFGVDGEVSPSTSFPEPGVSHRLTRTSVRFGYAFTDSWDLFGGVGGSTLTGPTELSAQGDAHLGMKWKPAGAGSFWALDAQIQLPTGLDGSFPFLPGQSTSLHALSGTPLVNAGGLALRVDGALGFVRDNTRKIPGDLALTPAQQYGLGIASGNAVTAGVAFSGVQGPWMPYAGISAEIPLAGASAESPRLVAKRFTGGFRWEFLKGATFDASADIALGRTTANDVFRTTAPFTARAGVSVAFDPLKSLGEPAPPPPPEVKTVYVEKPAPPPQVVEVPAPPKEGVLTGRLVGPDGKGIAEAVVDTSGGRTVTDVDGRFELIVLAGRLGIAVKHPSYEAATLTKEIQAGVRTAIELHLAPKPVFGSILGRITHPAGIVRVRAAGPTLMSTTLTGDELSFEGLAPGTWRLVFSGDDVLAKSRTVEVVAKKTVPLEVTLAAKPEKSALDLTKGIATLQPLPFEGDALAPAAAPILDEIADFLLAQRTDVKLAITALVPPKGKAPAAQARAQAVASALVDRGIPVERLETKTADAPKKAKPAPTVLFDLVP